MKRHLAIVAITLLTLLTCLACSSKGPVDVQDPTVLSNEVTGETSRTVSDAVRAENVKRVNERLTQVSNEARASYLMSGNDGFTKTKKSFPRPSTMWVPPLGSCCDQPDGLCQPDAALWGELPWAELRFSIDMPDAYSYQYTVTDDGSGFSITAKGDLDCDGEQATISASSQMSAEHDAPPAPTFESDNQFE